jgi:DNA-binding XRE family transcriptional regulator
MTTENSDAGQYGDSESQTSTGFTDNSELHPTVGPDWDAIEIACGPKVSSEEWAILREHIKSEVKAELQLKHAEEIEAVWEEHRNRLRWLWQHGSTNPNGTASRTWTLCWVDLPELQDLTETQLAAKVGVDKQTIGRAFRGDKEKSRRTFEGKPFQEAFPNLKTCHMKLS